VVRIKSSNQRGYTLLELMVAGMLSMFVLLALGKLILVNQQSWEWGRDKTVLQQNASLTLERISARVRAARSIAVADSTEFRCYDATGSVTDVFRRVVNSGGRLQHNGLDMVDRTCNAFIVTTDDDTTSVTIQIELADNSDERITAMTRTAIRNQSFTF